MARANLLTSAKRAALPSDLRVRIGDYHAELVEKEATLNLTHRSSHLGQWRLAKEYLHISLTLDSALAHGAKKSGSMVPASELVNIW